MSSASLCALGHRSVEAVVGHDFGVSSAAYGALLRPDIFKRMVLMSAPFAGPPPSLDTAASAPRPGPDIHAALAALPRPRKHYQWYYSTRPANENMWKAPQGVHDFLRAYYHHKSADWKANKPFELKGWTAEELAKMPTYYIMDLADGMADDGGQGDAVGRARSRPTAGCTEDELRVYSGEYERNGFQGGLQLVSRAHRRALQRRAGSVRRPHHRRALDLHLRPQRLGHPPVAGRDRADAEDAPAPT